MSEPVIVHYSIGSATNGVHMSFDLLIDDQNTDSYIDTLLERFVRYSIARQACDRKLKGQ